MNRMRHNRSSTFGAAFSTRCVGSKLFLDVFSVISWWFSPQRNARIELGLDFFYPPFLPKTISLIFLCADTPTPASSCSSASGLPLSQLELLEATHRGLYKFVPRHRDEMEVDIGDPIYVQKEADDCWCEGTIENYNFNNYYTQDWTVSSIQIP